MPESFGREKYKLDRTWVQSLVVQLYSQMVTAEEGCANKELGHDCQTFGRYRQSQFQCDQKGRLFVKYLDIDNTENWFLWQKILPEQVKFYQNTKLTFEKLPKSFKFYQSGEISPKLITLNL